MHGFHALGVDAQPGGPVFVHIALIGAVGKVLRLPELPGQEQAHAKPGHPGEAGVPLPVEGHVHPAVGGNRPHGFHIQEPANIKGTDAQMAGKGAAFLLHGIDPHGGPVIARLLP